ncbi:cobalamin biosynthesis protein [Streptomyces sp. DH12]|uniref:cobalamin biosynthesis protein n=1 Tax=Streptomyces sp. DH12 TaxID=2857010 RepID=UPI001E3D1CEE|nr:cobalamin biosynthesis protein [Streptomyces sp. DH12]
MTLVVGVGARRGVTSDEVCALVLAVLREAGRRPEEVAALATVEAKADEPGLLAAAARLGLALRARPAAELASVAVPHPSAAALAATGTPSVAEAAALAEAAARWGAGQLLVPRRKSAPRAARVTCAVAVAHGDGRLPAGGRGYTREDAAFGLRARR